MPDGNTTSGNIWGVTSRTTNSNRKMPLLHCIVPETKTTISGKETRGPGFLPTAGGCIPITPIPGEQDTMIFMNSSVKHSGDGKSAA